MHKNPEFKKIPNKFKHIINTNELWEVESLM